jgi:hypothetical protein
LHLYLQLKAFWRLKHPQEEQIQETTYAKEIGGISHQTIG